MFFSRSRIAALRRPSTCAYFGLPRWSRSLLTLAIESSWFVTPGMITWIALHMLTREMLALVTTHRLR